MIISTSSHNILLSGDLDEYVAQTMHNSLDRLSEDILSIDVFMKDVNGPKGGIDKQVVIRIHLRNRRQLVVETLGDNLRSALRRGAKRAKRAVRRSLDKSRRVERQRMTAQLGNRGFPSEASA